MFLLMVVIWCLLVLPLVISRGLKLYRLKDDRQNETRFRAALVSLLKVGVWALLVMVALNRVAWIFNVQVNALWFQDLGQPGRYWTEFWTEMSLFWVGFVLVGLFFWANFRVLIGSQSKKNLTMPAIGLAISLLGALWFGYRAESLWQRVLMFMHQQPFGKSDPIFGKDIAFYAFTMPLVNAITSYIFWVLVAVVLFMVVNYVVFYQTAVNDSENEHDNRRHAGDYFVPSMRERPNTVRSKDAENVIVNRGISHIAGLGVLFFLNEIVSTFMDRYATLYSTHGKVFGAGWTDLNVQIPAYWMFMVVLCVCIACLSISVFSKSHSHTIRNAAWGFGTAVVFWLLAVVVAPEIAQAVHVSPSEVQVEAPFIQHELDFTRAAYGIDRIAQHEFPVQEGLTQANLTKDAGTLESARLWDADVLLSTNHQAQAFKSYYSFADVDTERYSIGGKDVQLMYSSREMDTEKLVDSAKTWQNLHLVYTHGFGGTANPVNTFTSEHLPDYWVKDIPVVSRYPELEIKQPRIYFGEKSVGHVYVNTHTQEFDYPDGNSDKMSHYDGPAGISLGGMFRRLAIAWCFDGIWKTWSDQLNSESRILFDRDIITRTQKLVPFLWAEDDVYSVIADGQIWYMRDFYSVTEYYPYSQPHNGINYMRNSVKAVVNAYTGETNFYVFEPNDPVIRTYQSIYPNLFKPASAMPASLRKHARYPQGLLQVQGEIYANYHMNDIGHFYNREDVWDFAKQFSPTINKPEVVQPYYAMMSLPGNQKQEYVQILPFTPKSTDPKHGRNNLEAWLGARCDFEHYGELVLYNFPTTKQVQGPLQVGIKMNENVSLSKEFTLLNQHGSRVILGDMRALPLSDYRLLNVQAIYLQSEGAQMPQLTYVVVASGGEPVYDTTFEGALNQLIGGTAAIPKSGTVALHGSVIDFGQEIYKQLDRYFDFLRQGKFTEAGGEMQSIRDERLKMKEGKK